LTATQKRENEAIQRALHDSATGIPNRELFNDRLKQAIALAKRFNWILAVMFIDLDRFKPINDTHGHAIGDRVLQVVAKRLSEEVRDADTICRYGGDEFLYLLMNPLNIENIRQVALKVVDRISQIMIIDDLTLTIKPSIGVAVYPDDGSAGPELIGNADTAMYRAKETKTGAVFFNESFQTKYHF
jgi:diguanylate cyclase (GGDEF)-like protein